MQPPRDLCNDSCLTVCLVRRGRPAAGRRPAGGASAPQGPRHGPGGAGCCTCWLLLLDHRLAAQQRRMSRRRVLDAYKLCAVGSRCLAGWGYWRRAPFDVLRAQHIARALHKVATLHYVCVCPLHGSRVRCMTTSGWWHVPWCTARRRRQRCSTRATRETRLSSTGMQLRFRRGLLLCSQVAAAMQCRSCPCARCPAATEASSR